MPQSDWLMLYLAFLLVACRCCANVASAGQKAVGPIVAAVVGPTDVQTLARRQHAIWELV